MLLDTIKEEPEFTVVFDNEESKDESESIESSESGQYESSKSVWEEYVRDDLRDEDIGPEEQIGYLSQASTNQAAAEQDEHDITPSKVNL